MTEKLQISFLPWANFSKCIDFGNIKFIPYKIFLEEHLSDNSVRKHLENYFLYYVNHDGSPSKTIVIALYKEKELTPLSDDELNELREAVDALIFCTIAPQIRNAIATNNNTHAPHCSETFQLISQNFIPGCDDIEIFTNNYQNIGWKIGDVTFTKPWIGGLGSPDEKLMQNIEKFLKENRTDKKRSQLCRALEWFRLAHYDHESVSINTKVLMMATAFETILDPSFGSKKDKMAKSIDEFLPAESFLTSIRKMIKKGKEETYTFSLAGCWIWDFYKLRNDIVHGDEIDFERYLYQDRISQLVVADIVFLAIIKKLVLTPELPIVIDFQLTDCYEALGWKEKEMTD